MEAFLDSYGLPVVFAVMLLKSAGVPIPVPSDVILLGVAAGAANDQFVLWEAFLLILAAMVSGSFVQFLLARGPGRRLVYRFGRYVGLTRQRLEAAVRVVRGRGVVPISLAIAMPGIRVAAVPACGLAETPLRSFSPALVVGTTAFLLLHFLIGFVGLAPLLGLARSIPLAWNVLNVLVLLVGAAGMWGLLHRRGRPAGSGPSVADALASWQDAACPVCLLLGAAQRAPRSSTGTPVG